LTFHFLSQVRQAASAEFAAASRKCSDSRSVVKLDGIALLALTAAAPRRFKSEVNATCLIWKTMMVAAMSFRTLNARQLVEEVVGGTKYDDVEEVKVRDAA
jgi:predicted metal-binding membrane protein